MIKAIIFDVDGTLIDTVQFHFMAFKTVFKEFGIDLPSKEFFSKLGKPAEMIMKELFEQYSINTDSIEAAERKKQIFLKLVKGKNTFLPHTEETIKELKKKFKLALFTGSDRKQVNVLHKFLDNFEFIIAGKECIKPKPFPDSLLFIAKKLKVSPKECVYAGDLPVDMNCGKSAEMYCIGIENRLATKKQLIEAGANKVIKSLDELMLLKELQ